MFNYNSYVQPQIPRYSQPYQPYNNPTIQQQNMQQTYTPQPQVPMTIQGLQGKTVDSLDVVKAMDIPLDGSVSYFPLVDGSAIITKQLQQDGTSKTIVYKPSEETPMGEQPKEQYVTIEKFNEVVKDVDGKQIKEMREDIKTLKRQFRDLSEDIKDKKGD